MIRPKKIKADAFFLRMLNTMIDVKVVVETQSDVWMARSLVLQGAVCLSGWYDLIINLFSPISGIVTKTKVIVTAVNTVVVFDQIINVCYYEMLNRLARFRKKELVQKVLGSLLVQNLKKRFIFF